MPTITIADADRGLVEVYEDLRLRAEPNGSDSWRVLQGGRVMASRIKHLVLRDVRFNAATLSGYVDSDECDDLDWREVERRDGAWYDGDRRLAVAERIMLDGGSCFFLPIAGAGEGVERPLQL